MLNKFLCWMIRPKNGEVFILREKAGNPFDIDPTALVTIIRTKSGWVKYDFCSLKGTTSSMFDFWICYKRHKEQE